MIIKKYQGKTEEEAIALARKELGEAVVIMNVKDIKKKGFLRLFASPQVEVTVALEEETEKPKVVKAPTPTMTALETLAAKQREINNSRAAQTPLPAQMPAATQTAVPSPSKAPGATFTAVTPDIIPEEEPVPASKVASYTEHRGAIEEKLENLETLLKSKLDSEDDSEPSKKEAEDNDEHLKFTKLLYNKMIDNEVNEKYANAIIEEAEKSNKANMPLDYMLTNIYQKMILKFGNSAVISESKKGPKVVFFVGPTGVGKTTTIAKIASKMYIEEKKKVALLTADTYRIAAAEQLRTYANILEIPFRIAYSPADIEQALEEFKDFEYICVDTAGHSHHNEEQRSNTNSMIHAVDGLADCEVYLVLSATTKYKDLLDIADTYKKLSDYRIIFTKLDETTTLGNLLNLKLYTGADLSYVTNGQNVPDDIARFNPQTVVKSILGG